MKIIVLAHPKDDRATRALPRFEEEPNQLGGIYVEQEQ